MLCMVDTYVGYIVYTYIQIPKYEMYQALITISTHLCIYVFSYTAGQVPAKSLSIALKICEHLHPPYLYLHVHR